MAETICNTSPIQYLYQLGLLDLLKQLCGSIVVPPAVVDELAVGRGLGVSLPDLAAIEWVTIRRPVSEKALPLLTDLGPGEAEVLMLGLETRGAVVVLDDALARELATSHRLPLKGTLGVLLDAKEAGLIEEVKPLLDRLHDLRFRLAPHTRAAVLKLAGEA
ncbi:MAG: DUF3368 domain-containing protein [Acidobacteriota bacterium]